MLKTRFFPLENIELVINLYMVAGNSDTLHVQYTDAARDDFDTMNEITIQENYFAEIKRDTLSPYSDHFPFTEKDIPAMFYCTTRKLILFITHLWMIWNMFQPKSLFFFLK